MRALVVRGWQVVDARLEPARIRFVCAAILICAGLLLGVSFATAEGGLTSFGPPLGADFAGFYSAGAILNLPTEMDRDRLYDLEFQDVLYHQLLPRLADEKKLPFVHPPFVAIFFSYLARLQYEWAFGIWLLISLGLYLGGLVLLRRTVFRESTLDWPTTLLLLVSFEPFIFECWLGGQLSAFGFFCVSAALAFSHLGRPVVAGVAYGLLVYKPTLLVLVLPALVLGRRWRTLAGFAASASILAIISFLGAEKHNCEEYAQVLFGFAGTATGGNQAHATRTLELPLWKYVDLNSFLRLLFSVQGVLHWALFVLGAVPLLLFLVRAWKTRDSNDRDHERLVWAALFMATLVVNLYVGVYDTIFAVPAILIVADIAIRTHGSLRPAIRALFFALYTVAWITQPFAKASGVQLLTIVLFASTIFLIEFARGHSFCPIRQREAGL